MRTEAASEAANVETMLTPFPLTCVLAPPARVIAKAQLLHIVVLRHTVGKKFTGQCCIALVVIVAAFALALPFIVAFALALALVLLAAFASTVIAFR